MFGIDSTELLVIALVALVVIGPKDLPRVMRAVGHWVGRARGMASHFRAGVDNMIRESELADMEQKWKAENERIMREHPASATPDEKWPEPVADKPALPAPVKKAASRPKAPPARGGAVAPIPPRGDAPPPKPMPAKDPAP
jgi:sec-independent protein translocase protein TatB